MNEKQKLAANQAIAAFMGLKSGVGNDSYYWILDTRYPSDPLPQYTSPDSPRRLLEEVEAKAIEKTNKMRLLLALDDMTSFEDFATFATTIPRVWAILDVLGVRQEIEALADKGE